MLEVGHGKVRKCRFTFVRGRNQADFILPSMIPHPISDSIWLARGTLLVGAGHLMFMFGQKEKASLIEPESESLFEHVARLNGPLDDWNPQMILQCLLWGMSSNIYIDGSGFNDTSL